MGVIEEINDRLTRIEGMLAQQATARTEQRPSEAKKRLMTLEEAAEYLGVGVATLRRHQREIGYCKSLGRVYLAECDIVAYVERTKTESISRQVDSVYSRLKAKHK